MGDSTGHIVFINSHDYVSDVTGTEAIGCMVSLKTEDGREVVLYTRSLRLQHTLEMVFATKCKVAVDYWDAEAPLTEQQRLVSTATRYQSADEFEGPYNLKAMWTLE